MISSDKGAKEIQATPDLLRVCFEDAGLTCRELTQDRPPNTPAMNWG